MRNAEDFLLKINSLLDKLLETARSLEKLSSEAASEEEINLLQVEQEETIDELIKLDDDLHREYPEVAKNSEQTKILHQKMAEFQKINRRFIENFERNSGIIKFE